MKKRYRSPKVKPNSLIFQRGKIKDEIDMCIFWNNIDGCDRSLIMYYLATENINYRGGKIKSLLQELEERGYDLDTLKFSISKKMRN